MPLSDVAPELCPPDWDQSVPTLGVLEGRWKAAKAGAVGVVDATAGAGIQLVAEFASLPEWNEMRMKLLETEGTFDLATFLVLDFNPPMTSVSPLLISTAVWI